MFEETDRILDCDRCTSLKFKHGKPRTTGHSRYGDFAYLDTTTYVEVIFHSQHSFSIFLCISTLSMSKTVNMKQQVSQGDFSCPRRILYYVFATVYVEVKVGAHMGAIMSASAMYMY